TQRTIRTGETEERRAGARNARRVRAALGLGVVRIERQAERVGHLPLGVETDGVELVPLDVTLLLEAEVLAADDVAQEYGRGDRLPRIELEVREAAVALQPDRLLA